MTSTRKMRQTAAPRCPPFVLCALVTFPGPPSACGCPVSCPIVSDRLCVGVCSGLGSTLRQNANVSPTHTHTLTHLYIVLFLLPNHPRPPVSPFFSDLSSFLSLLPPSLSIFLRNILTCTWLLICMRLLPELGEDWMEDLTSCINISGVTMLCTFF